MFSQPIGFFLAEKNGATWIDPLTEIYSFAVPIFGEFAARLTFTGLWLLAVCALFWRFELSRNRGIDPGPAADLHD